VENPGLHSQCKAGITVPMSIAESAEKNLSLYK